MTKGRDRRPVNFNKKPARTSSRITRALFDEFDRAGTTLRAMQDATGVNYVTMSRWKHGWASPRLVDFENVAQALGYRLALVPLAHIDVKTQSNKDGETQMNTKKTDIDARIDRLRAELARTDYIDHEGRRQAEIARITRAIEAATREREGVEPAR